MKEISNKEFHRNACEIFWKIRSLRGDTLTLKILGYCTCCCQNIIIYFYSWENTRCVADHTNLVQSSWVFWESYYKPALRVSSLCAESFGNRVSLMIEWVWWTSGLMNGWVWWMGESNDWVSLITKWVLMTEWALMTKIALMTERSVRRKHY